MNFMKRAPNCRAQHKLLSVPGDPWQEQEQKDVEVDVELEQ